MKGIKANRINNRKKEEEWGKCSFDQNKSIERHKLIQRKIEEISSRYGNSDSLSPVDDPTSCKTSLYVSPIQQLNACYLIPEYQTIIR